MARPRKNRPTVQTQETQQLRALAHPLRLKLLESFARGNCTTMQVAEQLGQPPTRLYHHVNALERAGLLRLRETRPNRGTTEKYYEVARMRSGKDDAKTLRGKHGDVIRGLAMQVVEESRRELLASLANLPREGETAKAFEPPLAARMVLRVSPQQQVALRRRLVRAIQQVGREFKNGGKSEGREWAVTIAMAPTLAPSQATRKKPRRRRAPRSD